MKTTIRKFWPFVFVKIVIQAKGEWAYNYVNTEGIEKAISEAREYGIDIGRSQSQIPEAYVDKLIKAVEVRQEPKDQTMSYMMEAGEPK